MKLAQTITLLVSTVATGLIAGLFFAFACSVMPGLGRSSDRTFVEAMQNINKAILNPWFMLPFVGSVPLLALATVLAWRGEGRGALPWITAALALYVVAFLITNGANVPLNNRLERAGDPARIGDLDAVRGDFEGRWRAWHLVRTLLHAASFGCLLWALVLYGGDRGERGDDALPRPAADASHPHIR